MPGLFITQETLVRAFCWKLGVGPDDQQARDVWAGFLADARNAYVLEDFAARLAEPVRQAVLRQLGSPEPDGGWCGEPAFLQSVWEVLRAVLQGPAQLGCVEQRLGACVSGIDSSDVLPSGGEKDMQQPPLSREKIVKAIRWKLGIPSDNDPKAQEYWDQFCTMQDSPRHKAAVAKALATLMEDAVKMKLGLRVTASVDDQNLLENVWESFRKWFNAVPAPNRYSSKVAELISRDLPSHGMKTPARNATQQAPPQPPPPPPRAPAQQPTRSPAQGAPGQQGKAPGDTKPAKRADDDPSTMDALPGDPPPTAAPVQSDRTPPVNPGAAWKYKPLPTDEPDHHEESQKTELPVNGGWRIVGAHVRGKKHKHEGTHSDDWFEVRQSGPWVVIAVSDGGGSYRFSRVGARVSCQAAADFLATQLRDRPLRVRQAGLLERWWHKDDGYIVADDVKFLEGVLHYAMSVAHDAVKAAADERQESQAHRRYLQANRKLAIEDLSATLLLAVVTRVPVKGAEYTYAATCSVGDGMMAMIADGDPALQLLAEPDSGEHSGETWFLTSRGRLDPAKLKISVAFRPMKALMVMTDGVADDYFPADPGMLRLYADLVLNRVIKGPAAAAQVSSADINDALAACEQEMDVLAADPQRFKVRSAGVFADKMKRTVKELVASSDLLRAGAGNGPDAVASPAERLRLWLDAYQVRGSFDDRTLVVLHRSE